MEIYLKDLNGFEFKKLIEKLKELDLLIFDVHGDVYMKEDILVNSEINIIHEFVDDWELEGYKRTIDNLRYEDGINRGNVSWSSQYFKDLENKLNELNESKKIDEILNSFIENGYLYGCYLNNELIKTKKKKISLKNS